MKKNILMISGDRSLAEGKHGAFYNTLEKFSEHWGRVDVITPHVKNPGPVHYFSNVYLHSSPWPLWLQPWWVYRRGRALAGRNSYAVMTVHDYAPFYNSLGGRWLSRITRIPLVLEIMHIPGLPHAADFKERLYKMLTRFAVASNAQSARAVRIINQKQTRDFLIQAGVPISKINYIPAFYIDLNIFKSESLEKKYDLVYAARLEANKGILNLVKAVEILRAHKPDIKLCIVGDGPLRDNIQRYIKERNLGQNIEFSGWLAGPADVARVFNSSRIFVSPSLNEGGPRVVLEAMACGIPVITTPVGLMVDILRDGENGFVSGFEARKLAQTIERVLTNPVLAERCALAGLETAQEFECSKAVLNYAESLKKLTRKRLLVITQKVDQKDQLLGFFVEWLRRLGQEVDLSVLCLEKGSFDLPGIPVTSLGKEKSNSKLKQLWNFYRYIVSQRQDYDSVLVHMNPIWAALGGLVWRIMGKRTTLWYTHKSVTFRLRLAALFVHSILTASQESFRLSSRKVIVTGHGIDTDFFRPGAAKPEPNSVLSVGRIAAVKNYEVLIEAIRELGDANVRVTIAGEPALLKDAEYQGRLKALVEGAGLARQIVFSGKVDHDKLPDIYCSHTVFAHMSKTGSLDKTILEAMASGMTVVSSNDAARAFLPAQYCFGENDSAELARVIKHTLAHPLNLREHVVKHHNLNTLIETIRDIV